MQCSQNPVPIGVGYLAQYIVKPLLGWAIAKVRWVAAGLLHCSERTASTHILQQARQHAALGSSCAGCSPLAQVSSPNRACSCSWQCCSKVIGLSLHSLSYSLV